jgi:hypothetical protein
MARHHPRAPKHVVSLGKVYEGPLHLRKERSKTLVEWKKVVERDPTWSWPCEQPKLPQQRCRNHRVGDSKLQSINHCVSLGLLFTLPSSSIVLPCYILWCALLLCRYCVYPSLNISRSSLYILCELDCLLRKISLNSLIPVRPVWYTGQTGLDWLIAFIVCKFQVLHIHPPPSRQLSGT